MDKGRAVATFIDPLEINDKSGRIMLGVRHYLCAEKGKDMIRDDFMGFILEVCIIDAEVGVEPVDLASDEFARNKALEKGKISDRLIRHWIDVTQTLLATSSSTRARCSSLPLKTGVV